MRRTRFPKAIERDGGWPERPSIAEALWFDIDSGCGVEESSLATWRLASLQHAGLLLGAAHFLVGLVFLVRYWGAGFDLTVSDPLVVLAPLLLLDGAAAFAMKSRNRFGLSPYAIVRALCASPEPR